MTVASSNKRRLTPMRDWPERDRALWAAAFVKRGPFDKQVYGPKLRPKTVFFAERAYSRWLCVLTEAQVLDPLAEPRDRVTVEHVHLFLQAVRDGDNRDSTIAARFKGLRSALQILHPQDDFRWLTSPGGVSIDSLFPAVQRPRFIPDSFDLFTWGFELIDEAAGVVGERRRALHRNGVMIALLACRAPRLRTLAGMRLGQHVHRHEDVFHLAFESEDMKAGKPIAYDLPARLTPAIDRYLAVDRIELLDGRAHDWFWVGEGGEPLGERGIEGVASRASALRFGQSFRPHRFRAALVTTWAKRDPAHLAAASSVLGNTGPVAEKYYNLAKQADAARWTNAWLEEDREETRELAAQLFANRC